MTHQGDLLISKQKCDSVTSDCWFMINLMNYYIFLREENISIELRVVWLLFHGMLQDAGREGLGKTNTA